jgi:hypothetical protein
VIALPEKPKRFSKKTIIAVLFIALFTVSLAVVFLYPPPSTQEKKGYVNVSRSETYWQNTLGNVTEARYLVDYGIYAVSDTPKVTVTDKAQAHLTQIPLEQDTTNVQVTYDSETGTITVVATGLLKDDKVFAQAAFLMDPVNIFSEGEKPSTKVSPGNIYWGDSTNVKIVISPFRVDKTVNITEVGVYTWLTDVVSEIRNATTNPQAVCDPPMYQAIWQYKYPTTYNYGVHEVDYEVKIPSIEKTGKVLLRTWVEVRYSTALRMKTDGVIQGADGYFFRVDSSISYQYEHPILTRPIG